MYPSLPAGSKENFKNYPCECEDMRWMIDNNRVFKRHVNGKWVLSWIELDKHDKGTNIERFGVV